MNNTVQIQNLNFSFDNNGGQILNNVSLSIEKGKFLSILGTSGSGKSTLLRIISNILPTFQKENLTGSILIFGKSPRDYLRTGKLSFMFQEASLMPNLSVRDNICFPLKLRGESIDNNLINKLLNVIGLTEHQEKYPRELSGGMKTRVSLARAFVTQPEVLLLDEPFSALDISWRYELYSYLVKVSTQFNTTVILVTHDIQEAILLGDNVVVISQEGKVLINRKPQKTHHSDFDFDSVNKILKENFDAILRLQNDILVDANRSFLNELKIEK